MGQIIPDYTFPGSGIVPRETLNDAARTAADVQVSCCALGSWRPIAYGRVRIGAAIAQPIVLGTDLLLPIILCRGPINQVLGVENNGWGLVNGTQFNVYLGAHVQSVDPWLQSAWAASGTGRAYTDTLPDTAWLVARIPANAGQEIGNLTAEFEGLKVWNPTTSTTVFSKDPVLHLADFLASSDYGKGETIDWSSVITCQAINAATLGGEARREIGIVFDQPQPLDTIEEVLRAYAGVWVVREGGVVRFVPDAPASPVYAFTNTAGSANYVLDSLKIRQRRRRETPTVVTVKYTNTATSPWSEASATVKTTGAGASVPWREQVVSMPGIQSASYALREATRRLKAYELCDIEAELIGLDPAIQLRRGDVVTVTDGAGFAAKQFRLLGHRPIAPGRWRETLEEYDAGVYSNATTTSPGSGDTNLPQPDAPPTITGLALAEEVYQVQTGLYAARVRATWTNTGWPFIDRQEVELWQDTTLIESGPVGATADSWVSGPLAEGVSYTVKVRIVSTIGAIGSFSQASVLSLGKTRLGRPSRIPYLRAFETGGEVLIEWGRATDVDLTATELRYSAAGYGAATDDASLDAQWDAASGGLLDYVADPAIRYATKAIPAGTWRIYAKALDSVRTNIAWPNGQPSVYPAYTDVTVTSDSDSFVQSSGSFTTANLVHLGVVNEGWVSRFAQTWDTLFPGTLSSYTNPLWSYHTAGTSVLYTESVDVGAVISGEWSASLSYADIDGTATLYIETSTGPESAKTITGATNATPIVITSVAHGYSTGDQIQQTGVGGNTAANGFFTITKLTDDTYSLQNLAGENVAGTGAYTSGGSAYRWVWQSTTSAQKATARFVRQRIITTGTMLVTSLGSYRVNVVTRKERDDVTTLSSGGKLVQLNGAYTKASDVRVTPYGSTALRALADRVLVAPLPIESGVQSGGLQFSAYVDPVTGFCYGEFSQYTRVIASGDRLKFDVWIDPTIPPYGNAALAIYCTDSTWYYVGFSGVPAATWYAMDIDLTSGGMPGVGKTTSIWAMHFNTAGFTSRMVWRNVRITNGASTIQTLYGTSGEPTYNVTAYGGTCKNLKLGPANSFLAYAFDASNAQIASDCTYSFEGV